MAITNSSNDTTTTITTKMSGRRSSSRQAQPPSLKTPISGQLIKVRKREYIPELDDFSDDEDLMEPSWTLKKSRSEMKPPVMETPAPTPTPPKNIAEEVDVKLEPNVIDVFYNNAHGTFKVRYSQCNIPNNSQTIYLDVRMATPKPLYEHPNFRPPQKFNLTLNFDELGSTMVSQHTEISQIFE